ncbi:EAL domain-containing protein [Geoalkalibacter halelectricus]|uniref:EAL domain-containing protein n=1 Tax=Geoalkalibacter halelectricus TaxID=2847045 RepID=A0ABY5ZN10_9BACT|nr:EAL domain-containing protein [Geoalkalibacter halelectricus]MDO3378671.1 EAL domain-containing protein [Geoalkalibacter halelectricus]UWZ80018.1 EAL domain-containing protein [Geoalkalibacter halelectricus]
MQYRHQEAHQQALRHELELHREELQAQNDNLLLFQQELALSQRSYQELFDSAPIGYFSLDPQACVVELNLTAARLLGRPRDLFPGRSLLSHVHPLSRTAVTEHLRQVFSGLEGAAQVRMLRHDETSFEAHFQSSPERDGAGRVVRCRTAMLDLSERLLQERALERTSRAYQVQAACNHALLHTGGEESLFAEICRIIVEKGEFALAWVGLVEEGAGQPIRPVAVHGEHADFVRGLNLSWGERRSGQGPSGRAVRLRQPVVCGHIADDPVFGSLRREAARRGLCSCISLPLLAEGRCLGVLGIYAREVGVFDADEEQLLMELANQLAFGLLALRTRAAHGAALEQVQKLAYFDALTGLPNRSMFLERLEQALALARREDRSMGLLFLDLDRFKDINDTLGHEGGDELLKAVAARLRGCVRQSDTVARLGGDEFVIILHSVHDQSQVEPVAKKVLDSFSQPFLINGREVYSSTSIGIALHPSDGADVDTLIRHADAAMYTAKAEGRQIYRFFSPEMNRRIQAKLLLEQHLRLAWTRGEISLHYQPQLDLKTGAVVGVEALVRWHSPVLGAVDPERFIPLAEETGMILPLGEWVLRQACRQVGSWHRAGYSGLRLAVNIAARQFRQPDFIDRVDAILAETEFDHTRLVLEMTESTVMEETEEAIMTLTDLKVRGIGLSLDDFGTGYSSLNHLRSFPIDQIKIDRSFLSDLQSPFGQAAIIEAMIAMAHSLGLRVIAEGVEDKAQVDFLMARHCDEVQGFFWAHPLKAEDLPALLRADYLPFPETALH